MIVYIKDEIAKELKKLADKEERKVSEIVARLLRAYKVQK